MSYRHLIFPKLIWNGQKYPKKISAFFNDAPLTGLFSVSAFVERVSKDRVLSISVSIIPRCQRFGCQKYGCRLYPGAKSLGVKRSGVEYMVHGCQSYSSVHINESKVLHKTEVT